MAATVELTNVQVRFGEFTAVHNTNLVIEAGEFFSFLGPSGCGKTTLLRTISGFVAPTAGQVRIGGKSMAGIGPHRRPTALIFQNLALFPMMTVAENIAYGLKVRGAPRAVRDQRVEKLLSQVALPGYGNKRIDELSGGQKQRVAIARALAVEPSVLLLDEPLSALDLKLRQHMRAELRAIQKSVGVTFIYITHDQGEALTMSDRIAVMNAGHIEQVGGGRAIYTNPRTAFVASFVGENNRIAGKVCATNAGLATIETPMGPLSGRNASGLVTGDAAHLFIRPEGLTLSTGAPGNAIVAEIQDVAYEGSTTHITTRTGGGQILIATSFAGGDAPVAAVGDQVQLEYVPGHAIVLPAEDRAK